MRHLFNIEYIQIKDSTVISKSIFSNSMQYKREKNWFLLYSRHFERESMSSSVQSSVVLKRLMHIEWNLDSRKVITYNIDMISPTNCISQEVHKKRLDGWLVPGDWRTYLNTHLMELNGDILNYWKSWSYCVKTFPMSVFIILFCCVILTVTNIKF